MNELYKNIKCRISGISKRSASWVNYAVMLPVSVVFLYVFSFWTSPMYKNWYGSDASFFTLVGRGILEGKVPYRDFFDLKGPYFFFIEALGQLIRRGKTGIFIVQVIALYLSLVLMYRIGKLYVSYIKSIVIVILFLWPYASLLWGGNTLEEFCLPVNLLGIFLNLRLYGLMKDGHKADEPNEKEKRAFKNPNYVAMITGLCFTILTFSKVTAGSPLIGIVTGIFILHLIRRKYTDLVRYMLYFIIGAVIGLIPLSIYYGYHGCISEMLYCTFIVGFKRSSDLSNAFSLSLELKLSGVIFAALFTLLHMLPAKNGRERLPINIAALMLPMCVITYIALHLGDGYIYYFISGIPCLITALVLMARLYEPFVIPRTLKQILCWLLLILFAFYYTKDTLNTINIFTTRKAGNVFYGNYCEAAKKMGLKIPLYDKKNVFSLGMDMQWYEINDMMPCNRYAENLPYFISLDPSIEQELLEYLQTAPPKWIICNKKLPDQLTRLNELILSKYDLIYTTDIGYVYLLH